MMGLLRYGREQLELQMYFRPGGSPPVQARQLEVRTLFHTGLLRYGRDGWSCRYLLRADLLRCKHDSRRCGRLFHSISAAVSG